MVCFAALGKMLSHFLFVCFAALGKMLSHFLFVCFAALGKTFRFSLRVSRLSGTFRLFFPSFDRGFLVYHLASALSTTSFCLFDFLSLFSPLRAAFRLPLGFPLAESQYIAFALLCQQSSFCYPNHPVQNWTSALTGFCSICCQAFRLLTFGFSQAFVLAAWLIYYTPAPFVNTILSFFRIFIILLFCIILYHADSSNWDLSISLVYYYSVFFDTALVAKQEWLFILYL
jgi:hypothetical protein